MTINDADAPDTHPISVIARAWAVKMAGEPTPAMHEELKAWLAASPEHRSAYALARGDYLEAAILHGSNKFGMGRSVTKPPAPSRRWQLAGAATVAALLCVAVAVGGGEQFNAFLRGTMAAHAAEPLRTRHGEIRSFRLADGSTATLDTDSAAEVSMSQDERHLRLTRGRARLEIADEKRPFHIEAGAGMMSTHAATIDVELANGGAVLTKLASGAANIRAAENTTKPAAAMPLGEPIIYSQVDDSLKLATVSAARLSGDWPTGWVEYRAIPFDRLMAEANRYALLPIIIDDPSLSTREISGRFHISNTDSFVHHIADLLKLDIVRQADGIHLRRR